MAEWWEEYTAQPAAQPASQDGNWWDAYAADFGNVESGAESRPSFADVKGGALMSAAEDYRRRTEAGIRSGEIPLPLDPSAVPLPQQTRPERTGWDALLELADSPVSRAIQDNPLIRGFAGRVNEAAAGVNLLTLMPIASAVDAMRGDNMATDVVGSMVQQPRERAAALMPSADASFGEKLISATGGLAFDLPSAMVSKPLQAANALPRFLAATDTAVVKQLLGDAFKEAAMTARVPATTAGLSTALSVIDSGGTPEEAIKAGLADAGGTGVNFVLPLNIAGGIASRGLQGAAVNVVGEAAQNTVTNQFLPDELQRPLYDPEQLGISAVLGAPMAIALGERAPRSAPQARARELTNELTVDANRIRTPESDAVDAGRETARAIFAEADAAARPDPATNVPETVLDNSPEFSNQNRARLAELEAKPEPTLFEREEMALLQEGKPFDRQALLADLESAPEPELIRNGTRVFYPGDVKTMRAKLAEAGLSEGMRMTGEDGSDVGLYFPARLRAEVDAVLRPKPAEQAQPEPVKEGELPYRELGIPPPRKPRNRVKSAADFDPNYHDIRDFIALNGGLDAKAFAAEFNSEVPSPAENFRFFGKPLFRKSGGLQPDQLRELLQETGFLNPDSMDGVARYTPQDAYDLVDLALDGNPVYHPDGVDTQNAIQNYNNEYADLLRRQEYIDEHGVTPELDEEFARRADAMDRGDLEPVFSKRAKDRTATPDMFGATQRAQTTPTPRPASGDLFGAPTPRDRLDAAQRDSDARLTGPAVGMRQGDGELFAGPRPRQETIPPRSSSAPSDPTSWILRDKATGKAVMETADRRKVDALNTNKYEAVPAEQHMVEVNTKGTPAYEAAREPGIKRSQRPAERILPNEDMETAPLGSWVRGKKVPGVRDADLFQVMDVPFDRINAPELDSADNIAPERRLDAEDYTKRLRNGEVAPNARGYELPSGLIKLADGHRRMIAARNAGRNTLRIAVSPIDQEGVKQRLERPDTQGIEVDEATDLTPEELAALNRQVDTGRGQRETPSNDRRTSPSNADARRDGARRTVEDQGGRSGQPVPVQDSTFAPDAPADVSGKPPKFPRWFRQSKLKNPKGIPLEFNHTTNADFDTFDSSRRGSNTGYAPSGLGNWFSQSVEGYGSKKLTGNIRMENPKVMPLHKLPDLDTQEDFAAYADKLREQGFDGIYFPDVKQAVTFDSVQFKENNNTEYSESPNIYRSQRNDDAKIFDDSGDYSSTEDMVEGVRNGDLLVHFRVKDGTDFQYGIDPSAGEFLRSTEAWQESESEHGEGPELTFFSENFDWGNDDFLSKIRKSDSKLEAVFVRKNDTLQKSLGNGRVLGGDGKESSYDMSRMADYENPLFKSEPAGVEKGDWYTEKSQDVVGVASAESVKAAIDATNPSILKSEGKKSAPKRLTDDQVKSAKADTESRVASHWGRSAVNKLKTRGRVEFITKQEVVDRGLQTMAELDGVDGFFDPESGKAYVIVDSGAQSADLPGVLSHEVFHANAEQFLGTDGFKRLKEAFRKLKNRDKDIEAAYKRVPGDTAAAHVDEEGLAYLAQEAPKHRLSERLTDEAKLFLNRLGIPLDWLNAHAAAVRKIAALNLKDAANRGGVVSFNKDGVKYQKVFHGTPHRGIEKTGFSLQKIGTGEGAQAYGYGMYFAGNKDIAEHYRKTLAEDNMSAPTLGFEFAGKQYDKMTAEGHALNLVKNGGKRAAMSTAKDMLADAKAGKPYTTERGKGVEHYQRLYDFVLAFEAAKASQIKVVRDKGQLYHAEIPEDSDLLDYDKPISRQPEKVRDALVRVLQSTGVRFVTEGRRVDAIGSDGRIIGSAKRGSADSLVDTRLRAFFTEYDAAGDTAYKQIAQRFEREDAAWDAIGKTPNDVRNIFQAASEALSAAGIPGLRYLDGNSRGKGEGSANYVIWDETLLTPEKAQITPYYSKRDKPKPKVTGARPEELIEVRKQISSFKTLIKCLGG